ncbi:hypothetical protein [uncultured Microbacterium sp.]|uniref:hypothetical protein n=1 Tax=uncultured Microbacterium sp. TaxID=191216 RepID=UPI0035CCA52E
MIPDDWTAHRREDGEVVGWIRPEGDAWAAVDILGRDVVGADVDGAMEWLDAEAVLEARGLAFLADVWMLERADAPALRVRIVEVVPGRVDESGRTVVKTDDFGAIDAPSQSILLPWPAPAALRPPRADDASGSPWG